MQLNTPIRYHQSKLPFNFWVYTYELNDYEKLLLAYFYTSPFTNRLGCFQYDLNKVKEILVCGRSIIFQTMCHLETSGYLKFYKEWIFLPHYLIYLPIYNPNQGKHIEALFYTVPSECNFYLDLIHRLLLINHLQKAFRKHLKNKLYHFVHKRIIKEGK